MTKGWRTVALSTAVFLVGAADVAGTIDINAIVALVVPEAKVGGVVSLIGLAFGALRFYTTSAVGSKE